MPISESWGTIGQPKQTRKPMGYPLVTHGQLQGSATYTTGKPMDDPWVTHGPPLYTMEEP